MGQTAAGIAEDRVEVDCPLCGSRRHTNFKVENTFAAVRCTMCELVYVTPRPNDQLIRAGVETGIRKEIGGKSVRARRSVSRIKGYRALFSSLFADLWSSGRPIRWLDVGAGYGEVVEAVAAIAPGGSTVEGIEPMRHKVLVAQALSLPVREGYLDSVSGTYDVVSLINVFSHLRDIRGFLLEVGRLLPEGGRFLIETGNVGDLGEASEVPGDLDLPDHLVFAGEGHVERFLAEAGFKVVSRTRFRRDSIGRFAKNVVKMALGYSVTLRLPYTSPYRAVVFLAEKRANA